MRIKLNKPLTVISFEGTIGPVEYKKGDIIEIDGEEEKPFPSDDDLYFLISLQEDDNVDSTSYVEGDDFDEKNKEIGNCFRTEKEAKAAAKKVIELLKSLKK